MRYNPEKSTAHERAISAPREKTLAILSSPAGQLQRPNPADRYRFRSYGANHRRAIDAEATHLTALAERGVADRAAPAQ